VTPFKSVTKHCTSGTYVYYVEFWMWIINVKISIWGKMCN